MKSIGAKYFNLGPRLTLTFALLVALILGGNGLLIWQFRIARLQAGRLSGVSEQMISVLRLQGRLLLFHQRLDELAQSRNAYALTTESESLQNTLLEQIQQTREALTGLPSRTPVNPLFLPTLEAIEISLPTQLDTITALASSGDWEAVHFRVADRLKPVEIQASALVKIVDQEFARERALSEANMRTVQSRILVLVPAMAASTFSIATFFAWAIARKIMELRLEERVGERTRIARDLHDTLLQSFQGLMLHFQRARNLLPARPVEAVQRLDTALERAEEAIAEGRNAIRDIRSSALVDSDFARAMTALGEELRAGDVRENLAAFNVVVEGSVQPLDPILRDEIYRIVREALTNAFRHAEAHHIEAEIAYGEELFRVRIRDDGKGVDAKVLDQGERPGHWGLPGMRERTKQVGGQLDVWSEAGAGTEIELSVPGSAAYRTSSSRAGFALFRKNAKYNDEHRS
jgi:signal transduction histidine kinase